MPRGLTRNELSFVRQGRKDAISLIADAVVILIRSQSCHYHALLHSLVVYCISPLLLSNWMAHYCHDCCHHCQTASSCLQQSCLTSLLESC